jgi:aspartate aminotransferase
MLMNLSEKALGISQSPTLAINAKSKQMKKEGHDIVGFGSGEPDFDTPEYIKRAAVEALNEGFTKYTPVGGIPGLRSAAADYIAESTGVSYDANQVMISNGAKQCLFNALYCLLNPGDKVLIPSPYWVTYPELVKLCGGEPIFVPTNEKEGFKLKADILEPFIDDKVKALIINSPNNPTGSVYPKEDLEEIAQLAIKNNITVISDEIYEKLLYDGEKHTSIVSINDDMFDRTIVINGVSKSYSMTGWRIGFIAGPENIVKAMTNLQSHTTSNPNSIAQKASLVALTNPLKDETVKEMVDAFLNRRNYMLNRIKNIPALSCSVPKGAFYIALNISGTFGKKLNGKEIYDSTSFADQLLENYKVSVVPGIAFGSEEIVRISYATSMQNIEKGFDRIEEFISLLK